MLSIYNFKTILINHFSHKKYDEIMGTAKIHISKFRKKFGKKYLFIPPVFVASEYLFRIVS